MLVVTRYRVPEHDEDEVREFQEALVAAHEVLAAQRGYEGGRAGRNVDDPTLWTLVTWWADVGSYRRALSTYDVKVGAVPLLNRAVDEPSAYEQVGSGDDDLNDARPRRT